jgi:hypothetical protein
VSRTGAGAVGDRLPPGAAAALEAAEISASKLGPARVGRLADPERELYAWILRRFATSGRPSRAEIRASARRLGAQDGRALETLAREDLVHLGVDGEIAVAYPFSGRPTAHRVRLQSGHEISAMCAIDALGIAPMLRQPIEIASRDPLSEEAINVRVAPDGEASWRPEPTVVVAGALDRARDESCCSCCPALNFFASRRNAERWLAEHPEARGHVVSMSDAILAGRAVFGDVLEQT